MSDSVEIHFPTEEEKRDALRDFFSYQKRLKAERLLAVEAALPALGRLIDACAHKTGQSYKLRAILFSMWNGKPASVSETLCLDWDLKKDLAAVMLAFGDDSFFYDEISTAFQERGLLEWFVEEGGQ